MAKDQQHLKIYIYFLFVFISFLQSCGPRISSEAMTLLSTASEVEECIHSVSYTNPMYITGTAHFYKRSTQLVVTSGTITNMHLGDPISSALPIPFAEVIIYDKKTKGRIQCGKTNEDGEIKAVDGVTSLALPSKASDYLIYVYARTNTQLPNKNIIANVSVKSDIYKNTVYFASSVFTTNGFNATPIEIIAYARETEDPSVTGGAFNIYNDFIQAYKYLDEVGLSSLSSSDILCLNNRLNIFWKAGFNASQYEYPNSDPSTLQINTSYYKKGTNNLFITGGQMGDMSMSNTDHFDDFAILHEMGHFIEDNCGQLTKGGTHNLIVRIDPRLAWHEAWANFFSVNILKNRTNYFDASLTTRISDSGEVNGWTYLFNSYGFSDSVQNLGNGEGFMMNFRRSGSNPGEWQMGSYLGRSYDPVTASVYPGEGHFREGAISRGLFKISQSCTTYCSSTILNFDYFWQAMSSINGIGQSSYQSLSSSLFLENVKNQVSSGTWTSIKSTVESEALHLYTDQTSPVSSSKYISIVSSTAYINWHPYGHNLEVNAGCSKNLSMQPRTDELFFTGLNSDQRYSNHFYTIDTTTLSGLNTITLTFNKLKGTNTDIDIILYKTNYFFNEDYLCNSSADPCPISSYIATRTTNSDVISADRSTATSISTSFSKTLNSLSSQLSANTKYILNIRAYTAGKSLASNTEYSYSISSNLGVLCPQ